MMEEFKIEKGVEIPMKKDCRSKYPWGEMEVNDSVFFKNGSQYILASSVNNFRVRTGRKFSTRTVDGGVRVWRVE